MIDALLSPAGQALLAELASADDPDSLRLATSLRRRYAGDLVAAAVTQAQLRRAAAAKFRRAADMYFTRPGLEQASAEIIARHRAVRFAAFAAGGDGSGRVADLCTGIGGDLIALAGAHEMLAVDRDPVPLRMAQLNAGAYGVAGNVTARLGDVRGVDLDGIDAAFVDPARRAGDRRLPTGESEPPLSWCLALADPGRADALPAVAIKLAPGVDRDAVPDGWELEFVADRRELKEATAWSPAFATTTRRATVLPAGDTLVADAAADVDADAAGADDAAGAGAGASRVPVDEPGEFLLDPNPAVTRAGLVAELARQTGTWQIDEHIAFLASHTPVRTPFARTLRVVDSAPWREKELSARLAALGFGAVDVRRRGLAGNVERLHRRLKLRGGAKATLVMTRKQGDPWSLVCVDYRPTDE